MSIIRIHDKADSQLIETSAFKYARWDFDKFNPVQSAIFEHVPFDTNIVVAAATSAGKTVVAEMYMSDEIHRRGGRALYVGPLKALTKEKSDEWSAQSHHFGNLNISICSGDYRITNSRIQEMNNSNVIVMTPEMLASRCRNCKSEKSTFLKEVGTIVFDESHLLTVPSRGDHIEVALMKMVEINPDVRVVFLSATMPNVDEICQWLSELTGREAVLIESTYRPCPLYIHYPTYYDGDKNYEDREEQKVATALSIVNYYPNDKFLLFVHGKTTGKMMVKALKQDGIDAEFHNADLSSEKRHKLERSFKEDPNCRVIVATSTLAWGLNLPARRVVILGVHRGMGYVENYDIQQMIGRAGRPRYDPRGDAYILVPENHKQEAIIRLQRKTKIVSQLLQSEGERYKTLAFHVVSEIHHGGIRTKEGLHQWFAKSLAHHQDATFDDSVIDNMLDLLVRSKAITVEDGVYKTTSIGNIASMFYFSPFDVCDLKKNLKNLFEKKLENNDVAIAVALGNVDSQRFGIVNKAERLEMYKFQKKAEAVFGAGAITDAAMKAACGYHNLLTGNYTETFGSLQSSLRQDLERTMEVVNAIDTMSSKFNKKEYFSSLKSRLVYGVPENLVDLCQIPSIGRAKATKLESLGVKNIDEFCKVSVEQLASILKIKDKAEVKKLQDEAKLITIRKSL